MGQYSDISSITPLASLLSVPSCESPGGNPRPERTDVEAVLALSFSDANMLDILDGGADAGDGGDGAA